jgi:predicted lipoprotein with Yx(FWY)xxD motif
MAMSELTMGARYTALERSDAVRSDGYLTREPKARQAFHAGAGATWPGFRPSGTDTRHPRPSRIMSHMPLGLVGLHGNDRRPRSRGLTRRDVVRPTGESMKRSFTFVMAVAAALGSALIAAGCGGSSSTNTTGGDNTSGGLYGGQSSAPSATTQATTGAAMVSVRSTSLGDILVDAKGMTLYLFEKDTGTTSTCSGQCATFWPPLTTKGAPKAGSGADADKLSTSKRSDGTTQVTYNGHPLYYYAPDQKPGDTTGQGLNVFGATWYVLSPAGEAITSGP